MRLFTAILPDMTVRRHLCGVIDGLRSHASRGRFTPADNLHMTLVFLGECEEGSEEKAAAALDSLHAPALPIILGGLGTFRRNNGKLVWNGVEHTMKIAGLYAGLCAALEKGFHIDNRPYVPHITLGRDIVFRPGFDLEKYSLLLPPQSMVARRVSLMRSDSSPAGITYTQLHTRILDGR